MNIILGSENKSKERSIILALKELDIEDAHITKIAVDSKVSSRPINDEILLGARNRNRSLLEYCKNNNTPFDLLISIEGGYEEVANNYFIVTYASIIDKSEKEFIGKSQGLSISKRMFERVEQGKSLNRVIESIVGNKENKRNQGITGYLTDGVYRRDVFESTAVLSALFSMINKKTYKRLDEGVVEANKLEKIYK